MKTPILQFGTSRFLQAHADYFISQAMEKGDALGPVTVVQTSGSAERFERLRGLAATEGFPVRIRGIERGRTIDRTDMVTSVRRALSTATDWQEVERIFCAEVSLVICNTADRGYDISAEGAATPEGFPASFPGKLVKLMHSRYRSGGGALTVLPCELISRNGEVLKGIVDELARRWFDDDAFTDWLTSRVIYCNTLVDRIVSEALEPAGAVAEPYALWVVEKVPGQVLPCRHPAVVVAEDIVPFERLKLFILNLGHTVLAERWIRSGGKADQTVRALLGEATVRSDLLEIYLEEVVPGFAGKGMEEQARDYVFATLERFDNPFLDHRLADIAQNHPEKIARRIGGFLDWAGRSGRPRLSEIAGV